MVDLRLTVVSEDGASVPPEELQGKTFLMFDRDEPSGYLAKSVKTTGRVTNHYCPHAPS